MKRYVDFREEDWLARTESRMQAARWAACVEGLGDEPPFAGVIDEYPEDLLWELIDTGWVAPVEVPSEGEAPDGAALRAALRISVLRTLADDADCLAEQEHQLAERMLILGGTAPLETLDQIEAAYTLRMRLWCDVGMAGDTPVARIEPALLETLPPALMRAEHQQRRARIFMFEGLMHALLYINGYLPACMVEERFVEQVLAAADSPEALRLAHNYVEASFDTYETENGLDLLVHGALADPQTVEQALTGEGRTQIEITAGELAASMNGLLPEEAVPDEAMQRALIGALRPEYEPYEAASDLRFLAKQDAPLDWMQQVMAGMLVVMPTEHMDGALRQLRQQTPRWLHTGQQAGGGAAGSLH